ncbi:hypothetical protein [Mesorhizobium sp. M0036]|uniref:hypothetical protein n=1 Tax=Mesorhizobium sp. M0036 TaxID=2956853 RepID=UPI00333552D4
MDDEVKDKADGVGRTAPNTAKPPSGNLAGFSQPLQLVDRIPKPVEESPIIPGTFRPIKLLPSEYEKLEFTAFTNFIEKKLYEHQESRFLYYNDLRRKNSRWVFGSKIFLALAGSLAFLLTAVATGARLAPQQLPASWADSDRWMLLVVIAIYALMGAVSFYGRATDKVGTYFRLVAIILKVRDSWTKFQFELLKELEALKRGDAVAAQPASRDKIVVLAEAFCNDLNSTTTGELTDWRTEFMASVSELEQISKKGSEDTLKQMKDLAKEAAAAAEQAKTAAKAADDATRPGNLNLAMTGDFDGEAIIFIDGVEVRRTTGKTVAVGPVKAGVRTLSVKFNRGQRSLEASQNVEVKVGVQDVKLGLG